MWMLTVKFLLAVDLKMLQQSTVLSIKASVQMGLSYLSCAVMLYCSTASSFSEYEYLKYQSRKISLCNIHMKAIVLTHQWVSFTTLESSSLIYCTIYFLNPHYIVCLMGYYSREFITIKHLSKTLTRNNIKLPFCWYEIDSTCMDNTEKQVNISEYISMKVLYSLWISKEKW